MTVVHTKPNFGPSENNVKHSPSQKVEVWPDDYNTRIMNIVKNSRQGARTQGIANGPSRQLESTML